MDGGRLTPLAMKDLLEAGVHFGHQSSRWNPKMRRYIFAERGGIYLIDLKKTLRELERAQALARQTVLAGRSLLFVCTKPQLAEIVRQEAERCGAFYVTERWLGGMLTNFQTIRLRLGRLQELRRMEEDFIKQASVLSPAAKNEREQIFRRRMAEYQQKAGELNREVQEKQKDVLEAFRDKVEAVVAKVAKRNGLQVVIDKGKGGPAIYGAQELDITTQVIEEFNKEYP